ncbi:5-oxoprolinase/urea amidolyase family protein [Microbacterium sp. TNHR37B]|uniref:5-oxoprolinase subunit B/C family protein n=1 Tax=Microbacterium sp. TNHR37B TaxID=1775956 RepID=UPI0007B2450B|nr:5-oxoprolinase/urea amidolyase family protein [Microbacterium sp. TNHR37B]KZE89326.1 KipI antagonist [Microbacterium sp. TNHR37B]
MVSPSRVPVIRPMGDRAVLAEFPSLDQVLAAREALAASAPPSVVDIVPAARTVLVIVDGGPGALAAAQRWIEETLAGASVRVPPPSGAPVDLPVVYDGEDLVDLATELGTTPDALAACHSAASWTVAFTGFAPGFGYLVSADWPFLVSRRSTPRTRVPAGSVAVAGEFSGAYPRDTPGGWQLIGTTSARLFDPAAAVPTLLAPGDRVRFVPSRALSVAAAPITEGGAAPRPSVASFRVREPGLRATIQDQGRAGHVADGIASSGAFDRTALRTANRLVGNDEHAAGVEIALGGWRAVAEDDLWFAVTGGWGPVLLDGRPVDPYQAHPWPRGGELLVDRLAHGAYAYLAVRGGIVVPDVAGSRATDTLAGIGPEPLRAGDLIPVGERAPQRVPALPLAPWGPPGDDVIEVALAAGPRADRFVPSALPLLFDAVWTVSHEADRVGLRLDGPALGRLDDAELPSEGMVPGALQVPPSGRPVVLGPDAPVTGGYPVIAVVTDDSRDLLAQARPGTRLRFRHPR